MLPAPALTAHRDWTAAERAGKDVPGPARVILLVSNYIWDDSKACQVRPISTVVGKHCVLVPVLYLRHWLGVERHCRECCRDSNTHIYIHVTKYINIYFNRSVFEARLIPDFPRRRQLRAGGVMENKQWALTPHCTAAERVHYSALRYRHCGNIQHVDTSVHKLAVMKLLRMDCCTENKGWMCKWINSSQETAPPCVHHYF